MSNVAMVLKSEIRRLARREAKVMIFSLMREKLVLKKVVRDLQKKIQMLEASVRQVGRRFDEMTGMRSVAVASTDKRPRWFTAKGLRATRHKFKMSQAEFGKLLGVSDQSIYQWERKKGVLKLRKETAAKVSILRELGVREARRRLEEGFLAGA